MKITVISTNRDLVFFPNTKIRIQENNPMFHELGSYSFPFDIPLEENNRALDYPSRLTKAGLPKFEVEVLVESKNFDDKYGILLVTPRTSSLSVSLMLGQGRFHYKLKNADLRDLVENAVTVGSDTDDVIDHANATINQSWPQTPYNFPLVKAEEFYGDTNEDFAGIINAYDYVNSKFYKNHVNDATETVHNHTCLVPFLYASEILSRIVSSLNFKQSGNVINHASIKPVLVWNNFPLDHFHWPFVNVEMPEDDWLHITDGSTMSNVWFTIPMSVVNVDEDSLWDGTYWTPTRPGKYKFIVDFAYHDDITADTTGFTFWVAKLLNSVESNAVGFYGDSETLPGYWNPPLGDPYRYSEAILFVSQSDIDAGAKYFLRLATGCNDLTDTEYHEFECALKVMPVQVLNTFNPSFNFSNLVPDIKASEFWNSLQSLFAFVTFQDKDELSLKFLKDIVAADYVDDISKYMLVGAERSNIEQIKSLSFDNSTGEPIDDFEALDPVGVYWLLPDSGVYKNNFLNYVKNELAYYLTYYDAAFDVKWGRFTQRFHPRVIADDGQDINSAFSPMRTENVQINPIDSPSYKRLAPVSEDSAYSALFRKFEDPGLFLFNFLGKIVVNDDPLRYAPTASAGCRDNFGNVKGNLVDLAFNTEHNDLYENFWADYIEFLQNSEIVTNDFDMPSFVLQSLKFYEKYTAKHLGFIISQKDYEFDASTDEINQPVTLKMVVKR